MNWLLLQQIETVPLESLNDLPLQLQKQYSNVGTTETIESCVCAICFDFDFDSDVI